MEIIDKATMMLPDVNSFSNDTIKVTIARWEPVESVNFYYIVRFKKQHMDDNLLHWQCVSTSILRYLPDEVV